MHNAHASMSRGVGVGVMDRASCNVDCMLCNVYVAAYSPDGASLDTDKRIFNEISSLGASQHKV